MQDGSLVEQDLWIDERRGVLLDSQVRENASRGMYCIFDVLYSIANVLLREATAR